MGNGTWSHPHRLQLLTRQPGLAMLPRLVSSWQDNYSRRSGTEAWVGLEESQQNHVAEEEDDKSEESRTAWGLY